MQSTFMMKQNTNNASLPVTFEIGIMCHNEAQNIGNLLTSLVNQTSWKMVKKVIVISSGSTDGTDTIVKSHTRKNPKIVLIKEKRRLGKAHAVNRFLAITKEEVVVLMGGDVIPKKTTLEFMIKHFDDKEVGIVGAHPVPLNDRNTFIGFAAHLLWNLHHQISLTHPKMGEMIAFRRVFKKIPVLSAVDEVNIEALIRGQGYKAIYAPRAVVYNRGPETLREFISRRRSNYFGHLSTKYEYSYLVSTLNNARVFYLIIKNLKFRPTYMMFLGGSILLEIISRILGYVDYRFKRKDHTIWDIAKTTKKLK